MVLPESMHLFKTSQLIFDNFICDYASEQDLEPNGLMADFLSLQTLYKNRHPCSTKPHLWRNLVGSLPQNLSCCPLVETLPTYRLERAFFKVVAGIAPFCQP
jgi:hypothetical protein